MQLFKTTFSVSARFLANVAAVQRLSALYAGIAVEAKDAVSLIRSGSCRTEITLLASRSGDPAQVGCMSVILFQVTIWAV